MNWLRRKRPLRSTNDLIRGRMRWLCLGMLVVAVALGVRLYFVQVDNHERMYGLACQKYITTRVSSGRRGEIFDVSGNLLVGNAPCINLVADPSLMSDRMRREVACVLAPLLDRAESYLYDRLAPTRVVRDEKGDPVLNEDGSPRTRPMRHVILVRSLSPEMGAELEKVARSHRFKGLFFREDYVRYYPKKRMLANVLGLTNRMPDDSLKGISGIERFFQDRLAPKIGRERYERDRLGRPLVHGSYEGSAGEDGLNICLTIDEPIQSILEEELDVAYEKWRPKAIYAVMADPATGNIMAIAQRPTFDPNDRRSIAPEAWRLRFLEDGLEPGSIMKPFTVAWAIDKGVIRPETRFDCEHGVWYYLGKPLRDTHEYDSMSVSDIIQTSSNIGTAKIALEFGADNVYDGLKHFGFGEYCGLPLKPETRGILPPVKRWDGLSVTRFPIGYGVLVSPVQMVRAYCALANGGRLPKLRIVDRTVDPETGEIRKEPQAESVMLFRRPETAGEVVAMMKRVTQKGGTARQAAIPGFEVAGKTGTSRKYVKGRGYSTKYFASFVGFVPADKPAFVLLVTTDEPHGASYGGVVSGPVFRAIGERVLKHLRIEPDPARQAGEKK